MDRTVNLFSVSIATVLLVGAVGPARALSDFRSPVFQVPSFELTYSPAAARQEKQAEPQPDEPEKPPAEEAPKRDLSEGLWGYRGVSSFFNIREANSNVRQGEWEFEYLLKWETESGESDEIEMA